jgi:flavin reductase (DIM6/NTAB) family NADH-FMN oxidoreductase RutF
VDKLQSVAYHIGETGSPLLDDCIAAFDCSVEKVYEDNGYRLIIGRIVHADFVREESEPLIYRGKDY